MSHVESVALTTDEFVATIQKSSLATIIVEGKEDAVIYRQFEDIFSNEAVAILPVSGRLQLLEIFDRLNRTVHLERCIFICDKDLWVIDDITPAKFKVDRLITTNGYSIENDLIRDFDLTKLMSDSEKIAFYKELKIFINWFAFNCGKQIDGVNGKLSTHVKQIIDDKIDEHEIIASKTHGVYPTDLFNKIDENPFHYLRGKSLFALFLRQLSKRHRAVKHNKLALLDTAARSGGPLFNEIKFKVEKLLRPIKEPVKC